MIVTIEYADGSGVRFDQERDDLFYMVSWDEEGNVMDYMSGPCPPEYVKRRSILAMQAPGRRVSFES